MFSQNVKEKIIRHYRFTEHKNISRMQWRSAGPYWYVQFAILLFSVVPPLIQYPGANIAEVPPDKRTQKRWDPRGGWVSSLNSIHFILTNTFAMLVEIAFVGTNKTEQCIRIPELRKSRRVRGFYPTDRKLYILGSTTTGGEEWRTVSHILC